MFELSVCSSHSCKLNIPLRDFFQNGTKVHLYVFNYCDAITLFCFYHNLIFPDSEVVKKPKC